MPIPIPSASQLHTPTLPLHRIRFYDQTPSPITCLAYPPIPLPPARDPLHKGKAPASQRGVGKDELGVLVVARQNGDIEIHQWAREHDRGFGNWTCVKVLPPTLTHPSVSLMALVVRDPEAFHTKSYSVPKLEDLRLFTAGSDSTDLVERCLSTGRILSTYPIPSPPLWSLSVSPTHQLLCLATSSQSLHFLSIPSHSGPLEPPPAHLMRSEPLPSRIRTVSLAWGIPKLAQVDQEWVWRDTYLITGNSDSSFRRYDIPEPQDGSRGGGVLGRVSIKSRAVVEKVGKMKGKKSASKGTIVWGVAVLPDHTIVTSDSLGSVTFWDGASMAQKQTFSAHKADGMCLTIGTNGTTVFSSGPDQRVCQFTYIPSSNRWTLTTSKRLHSHDVRALAIFPPYTPAPPSAQLSFQEGLAPVLASGGWDMSLTFTPAAAPSLLSENLRNPLGKQSGISRCVFEDAFARKMGYFAAGRMSFSRGGRLVVGRKERSVGVWKVLDDEQGWEKVLEMDLRLRTNLISSTISDDGKYIAISDLYETKLFHLASPSRPIRIKSFLQTLSSSPLTQHLDISSKGLGSSTMIFTPDSRRLVLAHAQSGCIIVAELVGEEVEVVKCFKVEGNVVHGRVIAGAGGGTTRSQRRRGGRGDVEMGQANGHANGHKHTNGNGKANGNAEEEDDDEDEDEDDVPAESKKEDKTWISCLAASTDGQWLVSSDVNGKVTIFNLDTLQVHATLPTLPVPPTALLFPPSSPSLLLILTPNGLTPYHLEKRRLLPSNLNPQLSEINTALTARYLPALSACFEPLPSGGPSGSSSVNTNINKLVIWGHEYMLTCRIDIADLNSRLHTNRPLSLGHGMESKKSSRRKRAREAKEALERSTTNSNSTPVHSDRGTPVNGSSNMNMNMNGTGVGGEVSDVDGEMVKYHGGESFRSIIGVGWFGAGELGVVERPVGDFAGELPPAFFTASYGRS